MALRTALPQPRCDLGGCQLFSTVERRPMLRCVVLTAERRYEVYREYVVLMYTTVDNQRLLIIKARQTSNVLSGVAC